MPSTRKGLRTAGERAVSQKVRDAILKLAEQPTRRAILRLLAESGAKGMTVRELTQQLRRVSQPNVSHHLQVLDKAGVIQRATQGTSRRQWLDDTAKVVLKGQLGEVRIPKPRSA